MVIRRIAVLLAAAMLATGCTATGGGDLGTVAPPAPTGAASIDVPSAEPTAGGPDPIPGPTGAGTTTVRAYFVVENLTGTRGYAAVLRTIPRTLGVGAAAMRELLGGPKPGEMDNERRPTDIPSDARFLGLSIAAGVATVNLSSEFATGGTTGAIAERYGQVVYTLTQFPTISSVRFEFDGQLAPAHLPHGETTSAPVGRTDFVPVSGSIWVDAPAWHGALSNPARVVGIANVFEAQFRLQLLQGVNVVLVDLPVTATCGTGCWGTFDVTVPYDVSEAGWGTLRVFEPSARDGRQTNLVDYPVWLTPKG